MRDLLTISNPRLWMYVGGPYALGVIIGCLAIGNPSPIFAPATIAYFVWFLVFASSFAVGLNDYYDRYLDVSNERKQTLSSRYDNTKGSLYLGMLAAVVVLFIGLVFYFPYEKVMYFGLAFFAVNLLYNVPPFRFKERMPLDLTFGLACFIPLLAGYSLVTGAWPEWWAIAAGILYFLALDLFDKVFDIIPDHRAGLTTTAVQLGTQGALGVVAVLLIIASVAVYLATGSILFALFPAPYFVYIALVLRAPRYESLLALYPKLFFWNNLWGVVVSTYLVTLVLSA